MLRSVFSLVWVLWAGQGIAEGPTFDCAKVDHDAEIAVCESPALAELDHEMSRLYQLAMDGPHMDSNRAANLKATQIGWIKGRNECWKSSWDLKTCVAFEYAYRIDELRREFSDARAEDGPSRGPFAYACDGFDKGVSATFVNTSEPMVVLSYGVASIVLPQVEAASGAKYSADIWTDYESNRAGVSVFWTKGETAQFQLAGGSTMNCRLDETG